MMMGSRSGVSTTPSNQAMDGGMVNTLGDLPSIMSGNVSTASAPSQSMVEVMQGVLSATHGGASPGIMGTMVAVTGGSMGGIGSTVGMFNASSGLPFMNGGTSLPPSMIDVMQDVLSDTGTGSSSGVMLGMLDAMDDLLGSTSLTVSGQTMIGTMQNILGGSPFSTGSLMASMNSAMHNAGFPLSMTGIMDSVFVGNNAQAFEFTVTNGQVTGMEAVSGTYTHAISLPANAVFSVGANTVTETITGTTAIEVIQYAAEANNGNLYQVSQDTVVFTNPSTVSNTGATYGYAFTIANGSVTAEQQVAGNALHTSSFVVTPPPDAVFSVGNGSVTEIVAQGNTVEAITFVQPNGSSLYAVGAISTAVIPAGSAATSLSVNPYDRAEFIISNGVVTQAETVTANGAVVAMTPDSHISFTQLAPGFVEKITTSGTQSAYEVFYAGSGSNGIYTEVAHGTSTTVDLVGLQTQLAQLPAAVGTIL